MVSTDNDEIAKMAVELGVEVPFMRSKETADDFATIADVVVETLDNYERQSIEFDNVCCILPTAPFITTKRIADAFRHLQQKQYTTVVLATRFSYPIQRVLKFDTVSQNLHMISPEYLNSRSQDLPLTYYDCGQFYCVNVKRFIKERSFFTSYTGMIELPVSEVQDIDEPEDWDYTELKFKVLHQMRPIVSKKY